MKRLITFIALMVIVINSTGCASYMSYSASQKEIYRSRVYASGDADAVKAMNMGTEPRMAIQAIKEPGVFGLAINLSALDTIGQHPWRQLGAAAVDAATIYGGYLVYDKYIGGDDNSNGGGGNTSGGDNIVINGDGNIVKTGDTSSPDIVD